MRKRIFVAVAAALLLLSAGGCSVWNELWADTDSAPTTARERRIERIERRLDECNHCCK